LGYLYGFTGQSCARRRNPSFSVEQPLHSFNAGNEVNQTPGCNGNPLPEDKTNFSKKFAPHDFDADPDDLSNFMRFLQPPTQYPQTTQTRICQTHFNTMVCVRCHTTSFTTPASSVAVLSNIQTNLFSDLLVHHMGSCLADKIVQGNVLGDEFRTAPLWGAAQRVFFMHDGLNTDIVQAIERHFCAADGSSRRRKRMP